MTITTVKPKVNKTKGSCAEEIHARTMKGWKRKFLKGNLKCRLVFSIINSPGVNAGNVRTIITIKNN